MTSQSGVRTGRRWDRALVLLLIVSALIRLFLLEMRPPHHDEGVNGVFVDRILTEGYYRYDPSNYHGPLHFYLVFVLQRLFGKSLFILRLPSVLFGLLCIWLIFGYRRFFGRPAALLAAWAMALSPAFIFYSRYSIHETEMVFFTILFFWGLMGRLAGDGDPPDVSKKDLWAIGLGLAGMVLSKETYVIHVACAARSCAHPGILSKEGSREIRSGYQSVIALRGEAVWIACVSAGCVLFFYSGTFLYPKGIAGIWQTYEAWFRTGVTVATHKKPWFYWLQLLVRYEWPALAGVAAGFYAWFKTDERPVRRILWFGALLFLAYAAVPYKTPWCLINFVWPFYLLLGWAVARALPRESGRRVLFLVGALLIVSAAAAVRLNFFRYENASEPYVYTHTFKQVERLTTPLNRLLQLDPLRRNVRGAIILKGYWPLPWLLSDFTRVGYYTDTTNFHDKELGFLVVREDRVTEIEQRLTRAYFVDTFRLNSVQPPAKIYFDQEIFRDVFPGRTAEFVPKPQEPLTEGQGLIALFRDGKDYSGRVLVRRKVREIDFYWPSEERQFPAPFCAEFKGEIYVPFTGIEMVLESDDGGFVEIAGHRVIDDPGPHALSAAYGNFNGTPGWYPLRVGFYDEGGGSAVKLKWKGEDQKTRVVSPDALRIVKSDLDEQ